MVTAWAGGEHYLPPQDAGTGAVIHFKLRRMAFHAKVDPCMLCIIFTLVGVVLLNMVDSCREKLTLLLTRNARRKELVVQERSRLVI